MVGRDLVLQNVACDCGDNIQPVQRMLQKDNLQFSNGAEMRIVVVHRNLLWVSLNYEVKLDVPGRTCSLLNVLMNSGRRRVQTPVYGLETTKQAVTR